MKSYRVVLEGSPITLDIDDERRRTRFVVTRYVEAGGPRAAREEAERMLRSDPKLLRSTDAREIERMKLTVGPAEEVPGDQVPGPARIRVLPLRRIGRMTGMIRP